MNLNKPLWEITTIENESIMPLENEDGTMSPIPLMYNIDKIINVQNSFLTKTYEEGIDYILQDNKILILTEGNIKTVKYNDYYLEEVKPGESFGRTGGGYIYFGEQDAMHKLHIVVSYEHSDTFKGTIPMYQGDYLPKTITKLENKEPLIVLFYGDSITTGSNSSKIIGQEPFIDDWCSQTVNNLRSQYKYNDILLKNTAVGGTDSNWGAQNAYKEAAIYVPDLCFIAFGMNDGSAKVPADKYIENIKNIMSTIKESNPNCEFVLVATMLANTEVAGFANNQEEYLPALNNLRSSGIAVADVTTMHKHLLQSKRYFDMSGNNVNHPNDFLARVYAEVMTATIIK